MRIGNFGPNEAVRLTGQRLPVLRPLDAALCGGAVGRGHERVLAATDRVEAERAEEAGEIDLQTRHDGPDLILQAGGIVDRVGVAHRQRRDGHPESRGQAANVGVG